MSSSVPNGVQTLTDFGGQPCFLLEESKVLRKAVGSIPWGKENSERPDIFYCQTTKILKIPSEMVGIAPKEKPV